MMLGEARDILEALSSMGIELEAQGDHLRFRPQSAMTPDLLSAVKSCKQDLLEILTPDSLLPGLSGSGSRSDGAASVAQAHHTTQMSKVDIEWARFISVAEPLADGTGWFDPTQEPVPVGISGERWDKFVADFAHLSKGAES